MRVLLDSNILVRAFLSAEGSANALLNSVLQPSAHSLILSSEILREVTDVLRRPRTSLIHKKSDAEIYAFVEWLRSVADIYTINWLETGPIRDPHDTFVIHTALSGKADAICTLDRAFFSPPASTFLAGRGIEVMTDVQLMSRIRQ